jgi:hypothetical protein
MSKWFWKDGGENGNVEIGTYREQMRDRFVDGVLKAGVFVEAMVIDSEDQASAYWLVRENGHIVDSGVTATVFAENEDDTLWAFDLAQKAAEKIITEMPQPVAIPAPIVEEDETVVPMPRRTPRPRNTYTPNNSDADVSEPYINSPVSASSDYDDNQVQWWEEQKFPMVASEQ